MSSLILGTIGSSLLGPLGGFIGAAIGSAIDAYLFTPDPPDVEGPRLTDTDAVAADPGIPIPLVYGTDRVGGILLHTSDLLEARKDTEVDVGKQSYTNTTFSYTATIDILLSEGPILGIGRIWADGKLTRGFATDFEADTQTRRYNVGAFPYPAYFRNRMYDPALLPWHFDPAIAGAAATRWVLNLATDQLDVADEAAQDAALAAGNLVYWQDPASNYYIPTDVSSAYSSFGQDGSPREWDQYYNLHAALNDWSQRSIFKFEEAASVTFYRGTNDQPSDPVMEALAGEPVPAYRNRAHIVFEQLKLEDFGNRVPNFTFEIVRYEDDTLTTILVDLMTKANLEGQFYDLTDIPTTGLAAFVPGYTINRRTSFRKAVETLLEAFRIDVSEVGTKIVYRPRVRASEHVIEYTELGTRESQNDPQALLSITRRDSVELPRVVEAMFKDIEREYQDNSARWMRTQVVSDHVSTADLAIVVYPYFAKAWARSKLQEIWRNRQTVEFSLPPKYIFISPSDIVTVVTDIVVGTQGGQDVVASFDVKVTELRRGANGIIQITGVLTSSALYPIDDYDFLETESSYTSYTTYRAYGLTELELINLPPLRVSDNSYGVYQAMSDTNNADWVGAVLLQSLNGGVDYTPVAAGSAPTGIGVVTSGILAGGYGEVVENESSIIVQLNSVLVNLSSVTIDDVLNNFANMALIGNEVVCFTDVAFLGNRTYALSGAWVRGMKNTAGVAHGASERFVLLNSRVQSFPLITSYIDQLLYYKPVTNSRTEASTSAETFTPDNTRMRPFSPVMVQGTRDGSDNLSITWVRRDRVYYEWINNVDLALSEASLNYQVDILDVGNTVLRTISTETELAEYTAAQQTTDGLTPGDPVKVRIYQMSSSIGRGEFAEATI